MVFRMNIKQKLPSFVKRLNHCICVMLQYPPVIEERYYYYSLGFRTLYFAVIKTREKD